ncbi:MAG: lipopolysaccharide heptosyltransferase II [Verrucomicrobiota bacterium]
MKVLILKPSSLGDVVQALPVLRLLKAHQPQDQVYWWISSDLAGLLHNDPDLSGIFLFPRRRWASPRHWRQLLQSVRQMRAHRFDLVIDLQGLARSAVVGWLARGQLTLGVEDWREGAPALYDVVVPAPADSRHAVDRYLEVPRLLNIPVHWNFNWLPLRPEAAAQVKKHWTPGRWLVLSPGARWKNKRWPIERYAAVVRELGQRHPDLRFAILGTAADGPLAEEIIQANSRQCVDLTGRTTLAEMIEWVRLSDVMLTNDTGPMHIAAALRKPIVSVFGPTDPRRTGPYGQLDRCLRIALPCAPCLKPTCRYRQPLECLRAITPAEVVAQIEPLLRVE